MSNLICKTLIVFIYKYYRDSKKFNNLSFQSKYSLLVEFFEDLDKFNNLKTQKVKTTDKQKCV